MKNLSNFNKFILESRYSKSINEDKIRSMLSDLDISEYEIEYDNNSETYQIHFINLEDFESFKNDLKSNSDISFITSPGKFSKEKSSIIIFSN